MRRDDGHLLVLEGIVVAAILFGAVLFFLDGNEEPARGASLRDDVRRVSDDAIRILAGIPVEDERYGNRFLDKSVALALGGYPSELDDKLKKLLPPAASYNVYLDNGASTRDVVKNREPAGERVSSSTTFTPAWSAAFAFSDFEIHAKDKSTSMRVLAFPVINGRLLPDEELVANGGFENDADADGTPDSWTADGAATATHVDEGGDRVWDLQRASAGVGGVADKALRVDGKTGLEIKADVKGAPACMQVHYYDEDMVETLVGGVATTCVASAAATAVWTPISGTIVVADDPDVAYVKVELALTDAAGGSVRVDDVVVRPLVTVTMKDGSVVTAPKVAGALYQATTKAYDASADDLTMTVEGRYRHDTALAKVAYKTSSSPLLTGAARDTARAGLDASTLTVSDADVGVGETIAIDFDFAAYQTALGGDLPGKSVTVRVYEPVLTDGSTPVLLAEQTFGSISGTWTYTHPTKALYGPILVVASLEHDLADGSELLSDQIARKATLFDSRYRDGTAAVPPVYRVVLETWFPEWS